MCVCVGESTKKTILYVPVDNLTIKYTFFRNLMMTTTEDTLRQEFSRFKPGTVERVKVLVSVSVCECHCAILERHFIHQYLWPYFGLKTALN